jgi:hypothetical protein
MPAAIQLALFVFVVLWCASLGKRQRRLDAISLYDPMTGLLSGRVFTCERWPAAIRGAAPVLPSMLADARWNQLHDAHQAGATMDGSWMRST